MCVFLSGLLPNTIIMLFMFMSLKAATNNQPQVWMSGNGHLPWDICHSLKIVCAMLWTWGFGRRSNSDQARMCVLGFSANRV